MNEYEPWKETGETELEYVKRGRIEARAQVVVLGQALLWIEAWLKEGLAHLQTVIKDA